MGNKLSAEDQQVIQQQSAYSAEDLKKLKEDFFAAYPSGEMTHTEFVRDNLRLRGGSEAVWEKIFKAFDQDGDGVLSVTEYLVGLHAHQNASVRQKIEWVFAVFQKDASSTLYETEMVQLFSGLINGSRSATILTPEINQILKRVDDDDAGVEIVARQLFARVDAAGKKEVNLEDFVKACENDQEIMALFDVAASSLRLDPKLHNTLEKLGLKTFGGQVAGHGSESADAPDRK